MSKRDTQVICKSVFQSGENTITTAQFTEVWWKIIQQLEKKKKVEIEKR